MKVFVASMIAAYAAACPPCEQGDTTCWAKEWGCKQEDKGCWEKAEWESHNSECYRGGPSMEDIMQEAQKQISQWVYKDKDGKMKIKDVPDFAWNAVDESERDDFMKRQNQRGEASEKAWEQADMDLARGIEKPWNQWVQSAEDLSKKDALGDLDADAELANWMLDNIYIGGKTINEQNPNQKKEWDAQRDAARKEISNWSFDDLMFHMPADKKALILAEVKGEASMNQKWEQIIELVQKSSNFDMGKVEDMASEQARKWEQNHIDSQIGNLKMAEGSVNELMGFIKEHLEQVRKDADKGLTTLTKEEHEFLDQAIRGVEEAEMEAMRAINHEIDNLVDDMNRLQDTANDKDAWNKEWDDMKKGDDDIKCWENDKGDTECCNGNGKCWLDNHDVKDEVKCWGNDKGDTECCNGHGKCWIENGKDKAVMLASKKGASEQESTFASSFGYGAAAGVAIGAVVVYVANNKSKTADGFERV